MNKGKAKQKKKRSKKLKDQDQVENLDASYANNQLDSRMSIMDANDTTIKKPKELDITDENFNKSKSSNMLSPTRVDENISRQGRSQSNFDQDESNLEFKNGSYQNERNRRINRHLDDY